MAVAVLVLAAAAVGAAAHDPSTLVEVNAQGGLSLIARGQLVTHNNVVMRQGLDDTEEPSRQTPTAVVPEPIIEVSAAPQPTVEVSAAPEPIMEVSWAAISGSGGWHVHSFKNSFPEPPIVVLLPTSEGSDPATVRLREVNSTGFTAAVVVPHGMDGEYEMDGEHEDMLVAYAAVRPGVHRLPDGRALEAGTVDTSARQVGSRCRAPGIRRGWTRVAFQHAFAGPPAFVTTLQTARNEAADLAQSSSEPWLVVASRNVAGTGADVALESAETSRHGAVEEQETIGYLAMVPGTGSIVGAAGGSVSYAAVLSGRVVRGWANGAVDVAFGVDLGSGSPLVLGSQSSRYGSDGGWLRLAMTSSTKAGLVVDEDTACDSERRHTTERASLIAFSSEVFVATAGAPVSTAEPATTTAAPMTTAAPPVTTAVPPTTTVAPPTTTVAPPTTTAAPPSTTEAPPTTTAGPPTTTAGPSTTTAAPPMTTAAPPVTTAAPPATTNAAVPPPMTTPTPPATTLPPPVATLAPPLPATTAAPPMTTAVPPTTPTAPPVASTAAPPTTTSATTSAPTTTPTARSTVSAREWAHFVLVNELRQAGYTCGGQYYEPVAPLKFDCRLWRASMLHSEDMAVNNYFSHYSQDGRSPWDRARATGLSANGENIAAGRGDEAAVLEQWKGSSGHCRNMMNSGFTMFGVGHAYDSAAVYGHYWTQMFRITEVELDDSCYPGTAAMAEVSEEVAEAIGEAWTDDSALAKA